MVPELVEQQGQMCCQVWREMVQDLGLLLGVQRHLFQVSPWVFWRITGL